MSWRVVAALALVVVGGVALLEEQPRSIAPPRVQPVVETAPLPEAPRRGKSRPTAAEVIAKAGRRTPSGAMSGGRVLLAWSAGYGRLEDRMYWSAFRIMAGERVVVERLVSRQPSFSRPVEVEPLPGGFLLDDYTTPPSMVSLSGSRSRVRIVGRSTTLRPGDAPVGRSGQVYRPSTKTVFASVRGPGGSTADHVDGRGAWWALGGIEDGQQVLWSRRPDEQWVKHLVGAQTPYTPRCTCSWGPSVKGRGPVVVASMGPLNHVSLDYGATWRTYDLGDSEPFRAVYDNLREPNTSALPDGRIVTGYITYWVADDPSNTSFRPLPLQSLDEWRAGLTGGPIRRGGTVSLDGGETWVPLRRERFNAVSGP